MRCATRCPRCVVSSWMSTARRWTLAPPVCRSTSAATRRGLIPQKRPTSSSANSADWPTSTASAEADAFRFWCVFRPRRATVRAVRLRHLGARGARGLPLSSSIQGRFHYFDIAPYVKATGGTPCTLLPQIDALSWGLPKPGLFLWRVQELYEQGVKGLYIYQGDGMVLGSPVQRRCMRQLRSTESVRRFWEEDARLRPARSKGIYTSHASQLPGYHSWERLHIWLEGIPLGELELYLDDQFINSFGGPPYLLGNQDAAATPRCQGRALPARSRPRRCGVAGADLQDVSADESRGQDKESPPSEGGSSSRDAGAVPPYNLHSPL